MTALWTRRVGLWLLAIFLLASVQGCGGGSSGGTSGDVEEMDADTGPVEDAIADGDADADPDTDQPDALDMLDEDGGLPIPANLLCNPGFEQGEDSPECWDTFPPSPVNVEFLWDDTMSASGSRCAAVESTGPGVAMWRQVVPVEAGAVYLFYGQVGFEIAQVTPTDRCNLQVVFRNGSGGLIQMIDYPSHHGTRDFSLDFPGGLKVRAPEAATAAEINLVLAGSGRAFFDDIHFGPAPLGAIMGQVMSGSEPVEGARVHILGDPWGRVYEATTDEDGSYYLDEVPVAFPQYVLMASHSGCRTRTQGQVAVLPQGETQVDFELVEGEDPTDDLHIISGILVRVDPLASLPSFPEDAVRPSQPEGYPESVRPFLLADPVITSDHPDVVALAAQILADVDDPTSTREVAWGVYEWVSRHIEHGSVYPDAVTGLFDMPYNDVTSSIYQTISGDGWCWGRNFVDYAMRPHELLETTSGICVEHAMLTTALLRALNIPARPFSGALEFWADNGSGTQGWFGMSTTDGRIDYRSSGRLGGSFAVVGLEHFPVTEGPMIHEDWNGENGGLWRESHPFSHDYAGTTEGRAQALADMAHLSETGEVAQPPSVSPATAHYTVYYREIVLGLYDMEDQRSLDVRFPIAADTDSVTPEEEYAYWTNHPECVTDTYIEEITNPPVEGTERWYHLVFDLTSLLD